MAELKKGYWIELLPATLCDGSAAIAFIAKRTFRVPEAALALEPLDDAEQPPLLEEDRFDEGDATTAAPTLECELVAEKAAVDVIVLGKAYAPGGQPAERWTAQLRVGRVVRRLQLIGPRTARWQPPKKRQGAPQPQPPVISPPKAVAEVPLSLTQAYGGASRWIPDPSELETIRTVQKVLQEEAAEDAAARAVSEQAAAAAKAAAAEEAARDAIVQAPLGGLEDEPGLRRAWGDFGYDAEGVRLAGEATSKRGTAVLDLDAFAAWQAEQDAATPAPAAGSETAPAGEAPVLGEAGVELLDATRLEQERARARADYEAWRASWATAALQRRREQVQAGDGTRVLDVSALTADGALAPAAGDQGEDAELAWERHLRAELEVADAERRAALREELEAARRRRAEQLAEFPLLPCPTNPFGKGFCISNVRDLVDGLELPLIEDPDAPLTAGDLIRDPQRLDAVPLPAGFSVWPRAARPRIDLAGAYPDELASFADVLAAQQRATDLADPEQVAALRELERRSPPRPIQPGFFNAAAPWLQLAALAGDEEIELENLTRNGHLIFRLPGRAVLAELDRGRGVERSELRLDTLVIEPDKREVAMVWRAHYPLASLDELAELPQLVGWVLDLDVKDKRAADWAEQAAKARGDGTAVLDVSQLEAGEDYWRTISDQRKAAEAAAAAVEGTAALDIRGMGTYRQVDGAAWEAEVAEGVVDEAAVKRQQAEEQAWLEQKQAALQRLEAKERADAVRRAEVADAAKAGKPIPPPDHRKSPKQLAEAKKARAAKAAASAADGADGAPPKRT